MKRIFTFLALGSFFLSANGQIQWNDDAHRILADITVKQALPDHNFDGEEQLDVCGNNVIRPFRKLFVQQTDGANQEVLFKVNIAGLDNNLTTLFRICGSQNADKLDPISLEVFASHDASWDEKTANWNNTRNIGFSQTALALYSGSLYSANGKFINFKDAGLSRFVREALADGIEQITLLVRSTTSSTSNHFFIWSKEQQMVEWCSGGNYWSEVPRNAIRNSDNCFQQVADATVSLYESNKNFGSANALNVKVPTFAFDKNDFKSYLRFNLELVRRPVSGLTLHLRGRQANTPINPYNVNFYTTTNDWQESTVSWSNAPARGKLLATLNVNTNQTQWWTVQDTRLLEIVNSAILAGEKEISFAIESGTKSSHEVWFESKELNGDGGFEINFTPLAVVPVSIMPNGGQLNFPVQVSLSSDVGQKIYYTTDGSVPTVNSLLYSSTFVLAEPAVVRAVAFKDGFPSELSVAEFSSTATGVDAANASGSFRVWPNPASDLVYYGGDESIAIRRIEVLDASGRLVVQLQAEGDPVGQLSVSSLLPGVYFFKCVCDNQLVFIQKFIKISNH